MNSVVFLPGLVCDERLFLHQIDSLKKQFAVTTIICNTYDNMADHINYFLERAPEKFILIGHSYGGWIAQWIAIHAPERVQKLVLIGTGTGKLTPNMRNFFTDMLHHVKDQKTSEFFDKAFSTSIYKHDPQLLNLLNDMLKKFPHQGVLNQIITDLEEKDTIQYLKDIKCDTLLIHGRQDSFYAEDMPFLKENITNNTYIEIDKCGHFISLENPEFVSNSIKTWINLY